MASSWGANSEEPGEGRLVAALSKELTSWAEVVAPGFSRRQTRDGMLDTVSRDHRVFTNCATTDMRSRRVHASYAEDVFSPRMTSGHDPLCFGCKLCA